MYDNTYTVETAVETAATPETTATLETAATPEMTATLETAATPETTATLETAAAITAETASAFGLLNYYTTKLCTGVC